jgi:hypothetical protein
MAGYSGTPLVKKLGIRERDKVLLIDAPKHYAALLGDLPDGATLTTRASRAVEMVHLFVTSAAALKKSLPALRGTIVADGAIWVSWPKKASKMQTDVTEDTVREVALPLGLVDIKVCAVDDIWSGLKLVIRKELRGKLPAVKANKKATPGK